MCGIIGIFNHPQASEQATLALTLLHERGKEGVGIATNDTVHHAKNLNLLPQISTSVVLGHTLHAVVDQVPQPLKGQGILSANCEIYNWKELNAQYHFKTRNDAETLLMLLDRQGVQNLEELDGVYAFAYWNKDKVIITRDLLGEKPLWYVYTTDMFAFSSEKKVLQKLGYLDVQEVNPRHILSYDLNTKRLETTLKPFFTYLPEHIDSIETIKEKTQSLLHHAIEKRIPNCKFGLLFSGGVDSTYLANYLKSKNYDFTCYTAVLDTKTVTVSDLEAAQHAAKVLDLPLKVKKLTLTEIPSYLHTIVPLLEDSNVVKVGVALTFYAACELAQEDGCKVIFSGLGSEEIFAGYERHKNSANINQECVSGLLKMYERDLYRDDVITMAHNLELRLPFLDLSLIKYTLKIPVEYKLHKEHGKYILRAIAQDEGLPYSIAFRKKTAAQYGSRFDYALGKLAKKHKFPSKSAYLQNFYPTRNLRLGVLFSGGKDSTYAAYIMQQQNYELTCLITMKSENTASYMFQSAGVEIVELQAQAMGLPLVLGETKGEKEEELLDLERTIKTAKEKYKLDGIVSGALFSTYQRDRIEKICDKLGLKIFAPLWHKPQDQQLYELLQHNFEIILTSVSAEGLDKGWLNRTITPKDVERLIVLNKKVGINVAGEGGEFESLVLDCPLFRKKIVLEKVEIIEENKYSTSVRIHKAKLVDKM